MAESLALQAAPAFVLFAVEAPDAAALAAALGTEFSDVEVLTVGEDGQAMEPPIICGRHGNDIVLAALIPAPVPDDEALLACHPVWWDDVDPIAGHASQVVVVLRSPDDANEDPRTRALRQAMTTTTAAAALATAPDAVGVYVGAAGATFPAHGYAELFDAARTEQTLPVELWVTTWLEPHDDGTVSGWTHGLTAFGHAELDVEDSHREPSTVYGLLASLASHIVSLGAVLEPGHSIGWESETLTVSRLGEGFQGSVILVDF